MKHTSEFYIFLKENNALDRMIKKTQLQRGRGLRGLLRSYRGESKDIIMAMFTWNGDEEEYQYWKDLDEKWTLRLEGTNSI